MHIAEFQQWVKDADDQSQWSCLTTLQLLSHLTQEVGELAQSINRI
jgi:NTP pyrophosphatase (non-canonical NTP hydrolase)